MTDTPVSFNEIPGSGLTAPIFTFEYNSGENYQPGSNIFLFGCKTAAGAIALNTPMTVGSQQQADQLAGAGSMLREMYRVARLNNQVTPIYLVAVDDSTGTAPVWSLTIAQPAAGQAAININGNLLQFAVSSTDTPTSVAANLAAAINSFYDPLTGAMLPVTASSALGVVTVTGRHKVAIYNDLTFYLPQLGGFNVLYPTGIVTVATTTAGGGVPVLATGLAAIGAMRAEVVSPWSDTVSTSAYTAWSNDTAGAWSWGLQYYGHVWAPVTGTFAATTTIGLALNDRHLTLIRRIPGVLSDPASWVAARAAAELVWLLDVTTGNVSRNQTARPVLGVVGLPSTLLSSLDNYTARNQLLRSGISTFQQVLGQVQVDKTVTTYQLGASNQPDAEFRDVQSVYQIAGGFSYIRAQLAAEQGQKALAASNPSNLPAISTPRDVKASFYNAFTAMVNNGVFQQMDPTTDLSCVISATNPDRADLFAKIVRVNPLDIIAGNATFYSQAA